MTRLMGPGFVLAALYLTLTTASGCGGGGGSEQADAGACPVAPFTLAWPSEADPQVCSRPTGADDAVRVICDVIDEDCAPAGSATAPLLDCLTMAQPTPPPDPATVTLTGYADVFSSGPTSQGVRISLYRADAISDAVTDLAQVTPIGTVDLVLDAASLPAARACPMDVNEPADLKGKCTQPDPDGTAGCGGCPRAIEAVDFCHTGACFGLSRWEVRYAIPNVPTNTFLVMRTIGLTGGAPDISNQTWAPLVQYNIWLGTADRACTGTEDKNCLDAAAATYRFNANLISRQDFETIPVTAGLSAGVAAGHGAIAGEVHDCSDYRVEFAQVGFSTLPVKATYFNSDPLHTLPDLNRAGRGTSKLAIFAGLDVPPGPMQVEAIGKIGGVDTSLGGFRARVWPDTVTIVGINAGKPRQTP